MNLKYIASAAIFIAVQAHADDLFYAPNQANGAIVLTDIQGKCQKGSELYYLTNSSGQIAGGGCWLYSDPWVLARNMDGTLHQYMANQFTATGYAKSKYGLKSDASM